MSDLLGGALPHDAGINTYPPSRTGLTGPQRSHLSIAEGSTDMGDHVADGARY